MLRLVHPSPKGQEKRARKPHDRSHYTPTPEEQARIHAAIRNVARAYGGRDVLASVMGVSEGRLLGRHTRSYGFAYLLARAAGIPVEQLLSGQPHFVGSCALCGRKGAR
jgi:hypothetical protein